MSHDKSPGWQETHENAVVADLHAHPSIKAGLFHRNLAQGYKVILPSAFNPFTVRTAFPNLQIGGVDVLFSAVLAPEKRLIKDIPLLKLLRFVKPRMWREIIKPPYFDVTTYLIDDIEQQADKYNKRPANKKRPIKIAPTKDELKRILQEDPDRPIALIHSVEGAHSLQGRRSGKEVGEETGFNQNQIEAEILENLCKLDKKGVAYLTLAHFYPNRVAGSCFPFPEKMLSLTRRAKVLSRHDPTLGLMPIGESVVESMLEKKMIIDVTHSTPVARARIYEIVDSHQKNFAVIATHVGAYKINPSPYNLENWEIKWIADHGGVVGVIFYLYWLMPHETKLGLNYISRTIEHIIKVGGENSVAIGTDFDGFTDPPDEIVNASQMPKLTQRLAAEWRSPTKRKYSDATIEKILGGNVLEVLQNGWR
jgi:microsomal dipeptidase-like Zn-dependent dipeptidase